MKITKKQVKAIDKGELTVRELFPDVFKIKKESGWYKHHNNEHKPWLMYYNFKSKEGYGINAGCEWMSIWRNDGYIERNNLIKATDQEVEEALIKEAKRRGYKDGVICKSFNHNCDLKINQCEKSHYVAEYNKLRYGKDGNRLVVVYSNGKWAEIIETITIEQAEKELGKKIIK